MISIAKPGGDAAISWLWGALGETGAFSRRFFRNFFRIFAIGAATALLFACAAYLAATNGQIWRGATASGLTLVVVGIFSDSPWARWA